MFALVSRLKCCFVSRSTEMRGSWGCTRGRTSVDRWWNVPTIALQCTTPTSCARCIPARWQTASGSFMTSPTTEGGSICWKGESIGSMPTGGRLHLVSAPSAGSPSFDWPLALIQILNWQNTNKYEANYEFSHGSSVRMSVQNHSFVIMESLQVNCIRQHK